MPHRSPFTDWIADEWERLVRLDPPLTELREPPEDLVAGWKALYDKTTQNGRWIVAAPDASLVASLGLYIAWRQHRFANVAMLAREYLTHPDVEASDRASCEEAYRMLGAALIRSGQIGEGLGELERYLASSSKGARHRRDVVRGSLLIAFEGIDPGRMAESALREFVSRLLTPWHGQKRRAALASRAETYGELADILDATYPMA